MLIDVLTFEHDPNTVGTYILTYKKAKDHITLEQGEVAEDTRTEHKLSLTSVDVERITDYYDRKVGTAEMKKKLGENLELRNEVVAEKNRRIADLKDIIVTALRE